MRLELLRFVVTVGTVQAVVLVHLSLCPLRVVLFHNHIQLPEFKLVC